MVDGIGTTRVMCAVPSASKVAESGWGADVDWAAKRGEAQRDRGDEVQRCEFSSDICIRGLAARAS